MTRPGQNTTRKLLSDSSLPEEEFDGFCRAYFPQVQRRFTGVMNREKKIDVLLARGIPEYNYVEPDQAAELRLYLQTMGEGLLVEGPSGTGKTTATRKALEMLGQLPRTVWLRSLSSADWAKMDELIRTDFLQGGHLVIDDFHHLDRTRQQHITRLIKLLSDREPRDAKITLIGVNPIGASLLSHFPEVSGGFARVTMTRQPRAKIDELVRKGESAAGVVFLHRDGFIDAADGSFIIAQRLCREAALHVVARSTHNGPIEIAMEPAEAIRIVHEDLDAKFGALLGIFAACDEVPPPRGGVIQNGDREPDHLNRVCSGMEAAPVLRDKQQKTGK